MQVALLGPTVVRADVDAPTTPVAGERVRALLARLALDTGRVVPVGTLVDDLWGEHRPADELNALQSLVSRLRRAVPNGSVESTSGGYRLVAAETDFDAFETGVRTAAEQLRAGDAARAAETYATALRLWRGDPLADLGDVPFAAAVVTRWQELHLLAREGRLEAELSLGGGAVVADLETLVAEHPLRETSTALLIRALAATGRQAEALAAYDRLRERLADELGLDPGRPLEELQLAVLRGEVAPAAATALADQPARAGHQLRGARGRRRAGTATCSSSTGWSRWSGRAGRARPGWPPRRPRPLTGVAGRRRLAGRAGPGHRPGRAAAARCSARSGCARPA